MCQFHLRRFIGQLDRELLGLKNKRIKVVPLDPSSMVK